MKRHACDALVCWYQSPVTNHQIIFLLRLIGSSAFGTSSSSSCCDLGPILVLEPLSRMCFHTTANSLSLLLLPPPPRPQRVSSTPFIAWRQPRGENSRTRTAKQCSTKHNQHRPFDRNTARMSEVISKEVQDAVGRMARNDPAMTSLDLSSE